MAIRSPRGAALALIAGLAAAALAAPDGVPLPSIEKRWSIGLYGGATPLALEPFGPQPVLTAGDVTDIEARFVADPFLVHHDRTWHLFFEAFNAATGHGDIARATSDDGRHWRYERVVLDEPFHLAYPYVFRDGETYYMVPDSAGGSVRLYRGDPFPDRWRVVADLVRGATIDPSIVRHEGRWWLFAAAPGNAALFAYHADRPEGPWQPHAANPVVRDAPDHARPAGRIIHWNGRLIRFAQDDSQDYGAAVIGYEITALSPAQFHERRIEPAAAWSASGSGWNAAGMHHVDAAPYGAVPWIAAVDGAERALMFGFRRWRPWTRGRR